MNKRLALILIVVSLVIGLRVDAEALQEIKAEDLIRSGTIKSELFNFQDKNIKEILEGKIDGKPINYLEIKKGSKIKTVKDDNYLLADMLEIKDGKLNHQNKFLFMDGNVLFANKSDGEIKDKVVITSRLERRLVKEKKIDYDYWNHIKYQKDGYIKFDQPGYYLLSLKDSSYKIDKGIILISVKDKENLQEIKFKDVKENDWFKDEVYIALNSGILKGRGQNQYGPHDKLTVAEALTLAAQVKSRETENVFIAGGKNWYDNAIEYSIQENIVNSNDFKDYNRNISREEVAYVFARILAEEDYTVVKEQVNIPDLPGNRYDEYIIRLYKAGILNGRGYSGIFDPKADLTRAEIAVIINRIKK